MSNMVPMAGQLVWPHVVRPRIALVYLDLNHYIFLARTVKGDTSTPAGYERLLEAAVRAYQEQRALFPLSGEHLFEALAIKDPAQRSDLADVMETLSGFRYLLGRPQVAQLEIEAGIEAMLQESPPAPAIPLVGNSFGWPFGMVGGLEIVDNTGRDASTAARREMGVHEYEEFLRRANYTVERAMLEGPPDDRIEELRANGYAPETAREGHASRLAFELDLSHKLQAEPRWRKGRLRDVVSAREILHEWSDTFNRIQDQRTEAGRTPFNPSDNDLRNFMAALPHVQVAISLKTAHHRNPHHCWKTNDITDIDAMSVAFTYCDAVFTDKAIRSALANSRELRQIQTHLPRTPVDLADWLDTLPHHPAPWLLIPASRRHGQPTFPTTATSRTQQ